MTNFQALGKLIKEFGKHKPGMQQRVLNIANLRPLNACVMVMAELQRHLDKALLDKLGPAYDELQSNPLTNATPTAEQRCDMLREL